MFRGYLRWPDCSTWEPRRRIATKHANHTKQHEKKGAKEPSSFAVIQNAGIGTAENTETRKESRQPRHSRQMLRDKLERAAVAVRNVEVSVVELFMNVFDI